MAYNQPNMPTSDELAALFSRNMTFQPQPVQPTPQEQPKPQSPEPEITYSISQHYHHSAHIAHQDEPPAAAEPTRPSSEPPQWQQPSAEQILTQQGIDSSALSASQLQLFKTADDSQKMRLIELWRICPPTSPRDNPAVTWTSTTVEQEELLAQLRYEQRLAEDEEQQQQQQQRDSVMSLDGTPLTPVQTTEGRWVAAHPYVEPYMMSGYEELARREYEEVARRQYEETVAARPKDVYSHFGSAVGGPTYRPATDPVYADADADSWARRQQAMEDQYGAFQQMDGMEM